MTKSIAAYQFPQIVWREGEKVLWNPIRKKALKNRPEERVRLRIIEYLTQAGWSKHRISAEETVASPQKETPLRTDLICYTLEFEPFLLVECKAEQIALNEQTATQIARYNQNVGAPYLLMTNGLHDLWYNVEDQNKVQLLEDIPPEIPDAEVPGSRPLAFWKARGFAGHKAAPALRPSLEQALNRFFLAADQSTRFLSFSNSPSDVDLNNYYRIFPYPEHRLALTFTATPFGGSRLTGIINKDGTNTGVLEVNLDLLFDDRKPNASFYSRSGIKNIDARHSLGAGLLPPEPARLADALNELVTTLPAK